jgi:hypothetical protein
MPSTNTGPRRAGFLHFGPREQFHDKPYTAGDSDLRGAESSKPRVAPVAATVP